MKPGRNDPCPCGSGKKYKRCHGSSSEPSTASSRPRHRVISEAIGPETTAAAIDLAGFPGEQQHISVVNEFAPHQPSSPDGHEGDYQVVFVLSRPAHAPTTERELSFDLGARGDSHMLVAPSFSHQPEETRNAVQMKISAAFEGRRFAFTGHHNTRGHLSRFETTLRAKSFDEANLVGSGGLSPFLSFWSATQNMPVYVQQVEITELRTGNRRVTFNMPFLDAPPPATPPQITTQFLWFAALYREATNTNSPLYRFLCLYKIIEGVGARRTAMKARRTIVERIPDQPGDFNGWLNSLFPVRPQSWDLMALDSVFVPEARGRTIGEIRERYLRPLRNDVGHMFERDALRMWIDDPGQTARVHYWLPITTCIARLLMKTEFPRDFLPRLGHDGREVPL